MVNTVNKVNITSHIKSPLTDLNFTQYAEDNKIDPLIEHANRLRVVGNFSIGIYNLQILNVSLVKKKVIWRSNQATYNTSEAHVFTTGFEGIRCALPSFLCNVL
jgi:phosphoglycerate dehydrogenase-like enzyme